MICIIYLIVFKKTRKVVYVGSTNNLNYRIGQHKCRCNNVNSQGYYLPIYSYIRDNGGFNEYEFVTCGVYENITKEQRYDYEQNEMNKYDDLLNCI